jgi:tetratricopeptide (TPR) repeat protein
MVSCGLQQGPKLTACSVDWSIRRNDSKKTKKVGNLCQEKSWIAAIIFLDTANGSHVTHLDFKRQTISVEPPEKDLIMEKAPNAEAFIAQQKSFIASNPDCGTSHYNLGVALLGQGKIEEAEEAFSTAIECSPGLAEAYVQMGGICLKRGDTDGCLDWNQRAVKAKPGFSEGWGNIGFVLLQRAI